VDRDLAVSAAERRDVGPPSQLIVPSRFLEMAGSSMSVAGSVARLRERHGPAIGDKYLDGCAVKQQQTTSTRRPTGAPTRR
jgi:hypothetical protein